MDTSINSIENDIDDGFAAIDADIKKITFSTMELSYMNNQTLKEVYFLLYFTRYFQKS